MEKTGVLEIDLTEKKVIFSGKLLKMSARYIDFLVLLAQKTHSENDFSSQYRIIGVDEVSMLSEFRKSPTKHLGGQLRRFVTELAVPIVIAEKSKLFFLSQMVKQVIITPTEARVEVLPNLYDRKETDDLAALALAEALLEAGDIQAASLQLQTIIPAISSNLLVRAKILLAETWLLRGASLEANQNYEEAESALHVNPHPLSQSLYKVFGIRLKLQGDKGEHEQAEEIARSLLSQASPTMKARLENILGLVVLERGEPSKAEHHFQAALHFATEAHWWWGVLAAMSNLGLMALNQAKYVPQLSTIWLTRADGWLTRAIEFAKKTGLRYNNTERLIYAACVKNRLRQPHLALGLLQAADLLAQNQPFHRAWVLYELAYTHRLLGLGDEDLLYKKAGALPLRPQELHFLRQLEQEVQVC